jgi:hypothetical protein
VNAIRSLIARYQGYSLDPPLRSRFQARDIPHYTLDALLEIIEKSKMDVPAEAVQKLLGIALAFEYFRYVIY